MSEDPFPSSDFDAWAETYDASISANDQFPFAGYNQALNLVVELAEPRAGMKVLDLGTGTGALAKRFSSLGCELWCTDFSSAMLNKARERLPQAHFALHDLREDWLAEWNMKFDRIVSAYVFHHFEDEKKVELIEKFAKQRLAQGGNLIIADISFEHAAGWQHARSMAGVEWDEELYWTADRAMRDIRSSGMQVEYRQVSYCAGVYNIWA